MKPGRQPGDLVEIDAVREAHLGDMNLEDFQPARAVRPVDQHLAVEAPRPQQGRIEHFRAIGGAKQDHAGARIEAVELGEQLVERLLLLVVAAERAGHAASPQRVELVNEDDAGCRLARLLEQVADARGADADEHLDELGARDREKGHARLAGDGARQQRLSGARRADQQYALGDTGAQPAERFRIAQEGDDLLQLVFRLVDAGYVLERHLGVGLDIDLGARLADRHQPAEPLALRHAANAVSPDQVEDEDWQHPGQDRREKAAGRRARDGDAVFLQLVGERGIDADRVEQLPPVGKRLLQLALEWSRLPTSTSEILFSASSCSNWL